MALESVCPPPPLIRRRHAPVTTASRPWPPHHTRRHHITPVATTSYIFILPTSPDHILAAMVTLVHLEDLPSHHAISVPGATVESVQPIIDKLIRIYGRRYNPTSPARNTQRTLLVALTTPSGCASLQRPARNTERALLVASAPKPSVCASLHRPAHNTKRAWRIASAQTYGGRCRH